MRSIAHPIFGMLLFGFGCAQETADTNLSTAKNDSAPSLLSKPEEVQVEILVKDAPAAPSSTGQMDFSSTAPAQPSASMMPQGLGTGMGAGPGVGVGAAGIGGPGFGGPGIGGPGIGGPGFGGPGIGGPGVGIGLDAGFGGPGFGPGFDGGFGGPGFGGFGPGFGLPLVGPALPYAVAAPVLPWAIGPWFGGWGDDDRGRHDCKPKCEPACKPKCKKHKCKSKCKKDRPCHRHHDSDGDEEVEAELKSLKTK